MSLPLDPQAAGGDVHRLLQEALENEDRRLDALEERIHSLHGAHAPAAEAPDAGYGERTYRDEEPELDEAQALIEESGRFLRDLQGRIERLEAGESAEAPPHASGSVPREEEWPPRYEPQGSGAAARPRPSQEWPPRYEPSAERPTPDAAHTGGSSQAAGRRADASWSSQAAVRAAWEAPEEPSSWGAPAEGAEPVWVDELRREQERLAAAVERLAAAFQELARAELTRRDARLASLEERVLGRPAPAPPRTTSAPQPRPRPGSAERLRAELLAMGSEHQRLVEDHARLLERLVSVLGARDLR